MFFEGLLSSLPEQSARHVRSDLDALHTPPFPFLEDNQAAYQIKRLSLHLGAKPTLVRQAAIDYSLYVRQLDAIHEQENTIRRICAQDCPRPPPGCCNGEHHLIFSFSDIMFSRPTHNALHLAQVLTTLQHLEHTYVMSQGLFPASHSCSRLTTSGCSLRMFKSPRCIHYLCPHVSEAMTTVHGDRATDFLDAMHATGNQAIHSLEDFTHAGVIEAARHLFAL